MVDIEEIKFLYNKAQGNYIYSGNESRILEAFLIQSCIFEGVLKELSLKEMKSNLEISNLIFEKKNKFYDLSNVTTTKNTKF
jgi:hypothetical protein